jgi:anti-sigma factor RsiW
MHGLPDLVGRVVAPRHTRSLPFYCEKTEPKVDWQVMLVAGVIAGSFLAAWSGNELTGPLVAADVGRALRREVSGCVCWSHLPEEP